MLMFVGKVLDENRRPRASRVVIDFRPLKFVDPVGMVVISNLIEHLKLLKCSVSFINHEQLTDGTKFLDDSLFFERYVGNRLFSECQPRRTTVPLNLIHSERSQEYLQLELMPWVGASVGMRLESLSGITASLEEVFHNVRDHSGVKVGCTFAQHYPNRNRMQIAISDFGAGIPNVVRTKQPRTSDTAALLLACEEGFTTKTNVKNRGAGLPTLIKYVTLNNGGNVLIAAGRAQLSAVPDSSTSRGFRIRKRQLDNEYPGTIVRVILRTDTLELSALDGEPEQFQW